MLRFAARHPVHEIHVRKVDTFFMFLLSPSSGPPKFGRGGVREGRLREKESARKEWGPSGELNLRSQLHYSALR